LTDIFTDLTGFSSARTHTMCMLLNKLIYVDNFIIFDISYNFLYLFFSECDRFKDRWPIEKWTSDESRATKQRGRVSAEREQWSITIMFPSIFFVALLLKWRSTWSRYNVCSCITQFV